MKEEKLKKFSWPFKVNKPISKKKEKESLDNCEICGLYKNCNSPKMQYTGEGKKKILVLAEASGSREDQLGKQLIGDAGQELRNNLRKLGFDLDRDAWKTNSINCRPPSNRTPTNKELQLCKPRLMKTIRLLKPDKIILLGKTATKAIIGDKMLVSSIGKWVGQTIPDQDLQCWLFPTYHPSYLLYNRDNIVLEKLFYNHLKTALGWDKEFPKEKPERGVFTFTEWNKELEGFLKLILEKKPIITIDYETTGIKPHAEGHKIVCMSITTNITKWENSTVFPIFDDFEFKELLKKVLTDPKIKKVGANIKFENSWTKFILGYEIQGWHWDTMIATHILDNREGITGLKFQTYVRYGVGGYDNEVKNFLKTGSKNCNAFNHIEKCPLDSLMKYCGMDTKYTWKLYQDQQEEMTPRLKRAYKLFHEGILEYGNTENIGIHINTEYLEKQNKHLQRRIDRYDKLIKESEEVKKWDGEKPFNHRSNKDLSHLFTNILKYKIEKKTDSGADSTDQETLKKIDTPFTKKILQYKKLYKIKNTYLAGLIRENVNRIIRPSFSLHNVRSYRSSSQNPNFQNISNRDKEAKKITRQAIIPRSGRFLFEVDYSQLEVRIAACSHKDPVMIEYITSGKDMHKDQALDLFLVDENQMTKKMRYLAKNQFVFPQFYGSFYALCATDLWQSIKGECLVDGTPIIDHLKTEVMEPLREELATLDIKYASLNDYDIFELHIKSCEEMFWDKFKIYAQWKKDTWLEYQKKGYIDYFNGFRCTGLMKKNDVLNYATQGCLQGDSKVWTKKGWIEIKNLVGKTVEVWTGFNWAKAIGINKGKYSLATIYLDSGLKIKCDTRHKIKTLDKKGEVYWKSFFDIKNNDLVALPKLPKRKNWSHLKEDINWPFFLGFIIGDGHLSKTKTKWKTLKCFLSITVGEKKKNILDLLEKFLLKEGYKPRRYKVPPKGIRKRKYKLECENKEFKKRLESFGIIFGSKASTKRIPDSVWKMNCLDQTAFMDGLWSSDGSRVKGHNKCLHMCNKELLKEVQILVTRLGYDTYFSKTPTGYLLRFKSVYFNTRTTRKMPVSYFCKNIQEYKNTYRCTLKDNKTIVHKRILKEAFEKKITPNQIIAERFFQELKINPEIYRFDKVIKIEQHSKVDDTYTMFVNDSLHQFVADGVITKNSSSHILLWSYIQIAKKFRELKFKTRLIGQIHDSIILDTCSNEFEEVKKITKQIMCEDVRKKYPWILVPLEISGEVSKVNGNWFEKEEIEI